MSLWNTCSTETTCQSYDDAYEKPGVTEIAIVEQNAGCLFVLLKNSTSSFGCCSSLGAYSVYFQATNKNALTGQPSSSSHLNLDTGCDDNDESNMKNQGGEVGVSERYAVLCHETTIQHVMMANGDHAFEPVQLWVNKGFHCA
ncbi:hypothetical protein RHSIM_Rhsim06G0223400 [Rhododendron simsii]|uniref:Uncharacterized protein n=1 Tax=Rhododendron simsii TaxID=118357 RepID=A0A834GSH0_RHOSS|nr:hypothetical protein RHSIM_Rhsim06G0223400 [Rhododendron simsii]